MGLVQRKDTLSLTFAGQGFLDLDAIAVLSAESEGARRLVEVAERELQRWQREPEARWGGKWEQGASLQTWLQKPETRPNAAYFMSSEVSQSLIFLSQMVTYQYCYERGLHRLWKQGQIQAASGHSQGIMPALLVAESAGGQVEPERFATYLRYFLWQAVSMIRSWEQTLQSSSKGDNAPMAAISGLTSQRLQKTIDKLSAFLPPSVVRVAEPSAREEKRLLLYMICGPDDEYAAELTLGALQSGEMGGTWEMGVDGVDRVAGDLNEARRLLALSGNLRNHDPGGLERFLDQVSFSPEEHRLLLFAPGHMELWMAGLSGPLEHVSPYSSLVVACENQILPQFLKEKTRTKTERWFLVPSSVPTAIPRAEPHQLETLTHFGMQLTNLKRHTK